MEYQKNLKITRDFMEQSLDNVKSSENLTITGDFMEQSSDITKSSEHMHITKDFTEQSSDNSKSQITGDLMEQLSDDAKSLENLQITEDFIANPVGTLQENYQHFGTPVYSLVHSEGESHSPTFCYKATLGNLTAMGSGNSKKFAKHATAQALLELLGHNKPQVSSPERIDLLEHHKSQEKLQSSELTEEGPLSKLDINKSIGNTVGDLQEMCVKKGLHMPKFKLDHIVGQSHNPQFYMACVMGEFREVGVAGTKKDAKRDAAKNMIKSLISLQIL